MRRLGYSLQANAKTREGADHPDRDAQFRHINETVKAAIVAGEPTISVDTKKKELIGDFKNAGRELRPKASPQRVRTHDFKDAQLGKVNPYGVYDVADDTGWVSVGIDNDTAPPIIRSPSQWPGTARSSASAERWLMLIMSRPSMRFWRVPECRPGWRSARPVRKQAVSSRLSAPRDRTYSDW